MCKLIPLLGGKEPINQKVTNKTFLASTCLSCKIMNIEHGINNNDFIYGNKISNLDIL